MDNLLMNWGCSVVVKVNWGLHVLEFRGKDNQETFLEAALSDF
jgi:hypothetical protein